MKPVLGKVFLRFQSCLQVEFGPLRWDVIHGTPFFTH